MSDLNRKLHEAMGKCWHTTGEPKDVWSAGWSESEWTCTGCGEKSRGCPNNGGPAYDTDIAAAFELVEWMRKEKGFHFNCESIDIFWYARFTKGVVDDARSESLPLAIATAAAKALQEDE